MKQAYLSGSWMIRAAIMSGLILAGSCERFEPAGQLVLRTDGVEELEGGDFLVSGRIINLGDESIVQHGFCWAESSNPSVNDFSTSLGSRSREGIFSSTVSDYVLDRQYYFRAYASTATGTLYGKVLNFKTPPPDPPGVITRDVTAVTSVTATVSGEVTGDGGAEVTERGICWDSEPGPVITGNRKTGGNGTGAFTCTIDGLSCKSTYYARAFAINSAGAGYGDEISFTTSPCLPAVITNPVSASDLFSAVAGGEVVSDGGLPVLEKGVCWSPTPGATIEGRHTADGSGTGVFSSNMSDLHCSTRYYYRAYVTTEAGTGYGEEMEFTTSECIPETGVFMVSDNNGVFIMRQDGDLFQFSSTGNPEIEYYNGRIYLKYGRAISIYETDGTFVRTVQVDELINYPFQFSVLQGENFAFYDNELDMVSFANPSGERYMDVPLTDGGAGPNLQHIGGIVVDNKLILSEDGESRILSIDLGTYIKSMFRDFSHMEGWLGDIDYSDGIFYLCKSQEIFSFRNQEEERLICRLPEGNNTGIAVQGDFAYITSNFGNKVYRVNIRNGEYVVLTDILSSPRDIERIIVGK